MRYVTRQMPVRGYPHRSRSNTSSQPPPPRSAAGGLAGREESGHDKKDRDAQDVPSMPRQCTILQWPKPRPLPWHTLSSHPNTISAPRPAHPPPPLRSLFPLPSHPTSDPHPRPPPPPSILQFDRHRPSTPARRKTHHTQWTWSTMAPAPPPTMPTRMDRLSVTIPTSPVPSSLAAPQ